MELKLNLDEQELLADILRHQQRELTLEISHADHYEFKQRLRARAQLLEDVLDKLGVSRLTAN
jgi:hypothetical protein